MARVAITEPTTVAKNTALLFMPAAERIAGLTTKMYDRAKKVEVPAKTSVFQLDSLSDNLNKFSNRFIIKFKYNFYSLSEDNNSSSEKGSRVCCPRDASIR